MASRSEAVMIGSRPVGSGAPAYIVAEIGINHNGDMGLARDQVVAAAEAGADAVKFQNYRTEDFVRDRDLLYTYKSQGKEVTEPQYDLFKRCELSPAQLEELFGICKDAGVDVHSTPTGQPGIDELVDLGVTVLKNGSDFLSNHRFVRKLGETGLPTVLSTGMASLSEIDEAVRAFRDTGNQDLIVLHCVSLYPAPPETLNLRRISTLSKVLDCPIGFSDHSAGHVASVTSVGLGACWIEKHFTLDRDLPGPDHWFSSTPDEFKTLVNAVRDAEAALGSDRIELTGPEKGMRSIATLSCVAARDLPAGTVLSEDDLDYRRPAEGLPPEMTKFILGRKLRHAVTHNTALQVGDFE